MKESLLNTEKLAFARLTIEFSSFCLDKFPKKLFLEKIWQRWHEWLKW